MSNESSNIIFYDKLGKPITYTQVIRVCKEHGLGNLINIENILGKTNVIFIVETSKGKYVLKFYTFKPTGKRLVYVEDIINLLQNSGIPALQSIRNKQGKCYTRINNHIIQVYPYVQGEKFSFSHQQVKSNGRMLKEFHSSLMFSPQGPSPSYSNIPSPENLDKKLNYLYKKQKYFSDKSSLSTIQTLYTTIMNLWNQVKTSSLPKTVIHDDWHPWNQIYSQQGQIICILDLDGVQNSLRIYDVAYALYHISMNSTNENRKVLTEMFLLGYGGLNSEEKEILPLVIAMVALYFIIRSPKKAEKHLYENSHFIQFLLSEEAKNYFN